MDTQFEVAVAPSPGGKPDALECESCPVRETSFCGAVPRSDLEMLAASRRRAAFGKQQLIVTAGEVATHIFNVISGVVKLFRSAADGRTQIVGFRAHGELFATTESERYVTNAEAVTCVEVCSFPRSRLERLLSEYPEAQARLLQMSYQQIAASENHMFLLGRKTAQERVATFLLAFGNQPIRDQLENIQYASLPITRSDIADFLGLTTETVSRVITKFARAKIVTVGKYHSINLVDVKALEKISRPGGVGSGLFGNGLSARRGMTSGGQVQRSAKT